MTVDGLEKYFGAADFVIFIGLLVVSAAIGAYFAYKDRRDKSTDNYYFGDRKMSPMAVAMSMAVSFVSAITVIGFPVEAYLYGTVLLWVIPAQFFSACIAAIYYIPLIHRLKLTTIYEYLEMRFGKIVRRLCSGIVIPEMIIYMGITVYLPALALNAVTPLHLNWSIALTSIICTFYTSVGGMKAVIWTDVVQGMIMIFGSLAVLVKTTIEVGGLGNLSEAVERGERNNFFKFDPDPRIRSSALTMFMGMAINTVVGSCCSQVYSQRYLSCKNARDAKIAAFVRVIPAALFMLLATANGMAMYAYYEGCDPTSAEIIAKQDQTTPRMAVEVFQDMPGMAGLFVSAAYSGTLSTVSSGVNALAAQALEDFIKPRWPKLSNATMTLISKILSLLFGLAVMAVAYTTSLLQSTVIQISMTMAGILGGPILSVYTMGVFVPWTNKWGAFFGMIIGWVVSAWVSMAAIVHKPAEIFRQTLELTTESCNFTIMNDVANSSSLLDDGSGNWDVTTALFETTAAAYRDPLADTLYSLSPFMYGVLGFITACVAMFLISLVTGLNKASEMDPALFVPFLDNKKVFPKCVVKFFRFGVPEVCAKATEASKQEANGNAQGEMMLSCTDECPPPSDDMTPLNSTIDLRL